MRWEGQAHHAREKWSKMGAGHPGVEGTWGVIVSKKISQNRGSTLPYLIIFSL